MKALTLHQPWASLIAVGAKRIETRSWSTTYRGPLAIHAGARKPELDEYYGEPHGSLGYWRGETDYVEAAQWCPPQDGDPFWRLYVGPDFIEPHPMPLGAVVATCELVDVVPIVDGTHDDSKTRSILQNGDRLYYDDGFGLDPVEGQIPFGDFTVGRYAWLLDAIKPLDEPLPAKGHQGLWEWAS